MALGMRSLERDKRSETLSSNAIARGYMFCSLGGFIDHAGKAGSEIVHWKVNGLYGSFASY